MNSTLTRRRIGRHTGRSPFGPGRRMHEDQRTGSPAPARVLFDGAAMAVLVQPLVPADVSAMAKRS